MTENSNTTISSELQEKINKKIAAIDGIADELPGVIIIHNISKNFTVEYMSPRGLAQLGVELEELKAMGTEYYPRFFNPDDSAEHITKSTAMLEKNTDDNISLFQQVRFKGVEDWVWHICSMKIFIRDDTGKPLLTIAIAFPIDPEHHITNKVTRLLDENDFLRNHYQEYSKLGKREREVLRLLALGKSSSEIANELFISTATAETHRRNIRQKLNISSFFELSQYARAFDLICYSSFFITII